MSFIALLLYLFCTFIRPQDWMVGFEGVPLISGLAFATFLFLTIERAGSKGNALVKVPQNKFIVGFLICVVFSHLVHTYLGGLIESSQAFMVILILYFLMLNAVNSSVKFKIAVWFIIILITILVQQGIFQAEHGYGWAGQGITIDIHRDEYRVNWIGIFNDPNDLALIFVIAIGIIMAFAFGRATYLQRLIAFPMIAFLFYGIFLTNSRGGILALMATICFYFIKRSGKLVIGGIIGGVLAFVALIFGPSRMGTVSTDEASAYGRIDLWYQGMQLIKSSPLFGVGQGMFTDQLPQTAHNSFVLAAAEVGLLGLYFWVGMLYVSFKELSIVQKNNLHLRSYALGLQSGLIGFCAAAFFLSRTYNIVPYLLVALSGSLFHAARLKDSTIDFKLTKKDYKNVGFLTIGVMVMVVIVIKVGI